MGINADRRWALLALVVVLASPRAVCPRLAAQETRPAATQPARPGALAKAKQAFMRGDYSAAAGLYRKALGKQSIRAAAGVALARAEAVQGRYTKALEALDKVADQAADQADWHLARAEVLARLGRYAPALARAVKACRLAPDWAPPILARGELLETLGRKKQAVAIYETMARVVAGQAYRRDPRSLVALGRILDRYAVLTGRKTSDQADNILANYLRKAGEEVDKTYWPGHVATGRFLLAKRRPASATKAFLAAAKLNRRIPEVHVGLGQISLQKWRFEQCLKGVGEALKINPVHDEALLLKAACFMQWRKLDEVAGVLDEVLAINPNHIEALSLMAALHVRLGQAHKAKPYEQRVAAINPNCALLPLTTGRWLAARRQHDQAVKYYRRAVELAPEQAETWTALGLLYMQSGEEAEARKALAKAHQIDDFRADVVNYLRLLKRMDRFAVKETDHFIVKVDPKHDKVLLDLVCEYMERIYPEICGDYGYQPTRKTIVEIFPTDLQFGLRITGRGWIGTVGACTGRVIAMVAPSKEGTRFGTHNWAAVLRHEFTHTVTLGGTGNRIPHWFTEACAVWQQPDSQSYEAVMRLAAAVRANKLLPIKELNWGFVRPRRGGDRGLAYAQSEWILEYIIETRGYATVGKMLRAFRDGKRQAGVFGELLGVTEEQFDTDFGKWARDKVRGWGFGLTPPPGLAKAAKAAKDNPRDPAAQAGLAEAYLHRGKCPEAAKAARKALDLEPENVVALAVMARVHLAGKKYDDAIEAAARLEQLDHDSRVAPRVLAECYLKKRRGAKAVAALELLKQRKPLDPYSYEELARIYTQVGQPEKALPNLIELHRRAFKTAVHARQLADIYRALGKNDQALDYLRRATYVDPYDASVYEKMASIYRDTERYARAVAAISNVCLLCPESAQAWTKMAMIRCLAGRKAKSPAQLKRAEQAARKAIELDPDSRQAKAVLQYVEAAIEELGPAGTDSRQTDQ